MAAITVLVVWSAFFCDYLLMTMVIPIFPLLGASDFLTGVLFSSKAACQILFSPVTATFVEKDERILVAVGLFLEAFSCLILSCTFSYTSWMGARALSGMASAAIISGGLAHIKRTHDDANACATAMGLATTGIICGVCLGPALGGALFEVDPKLPFAFLLTLEIFVGLLVLTCTSKTSYNAGAAEEETRLAKIIVHPQVWRPLGALAVANAAISCLESTFTRFCLNAFGWSVTQVGLSYLITSVPCCVLSAAAGPLGNYLGDRTKLLTAGLLIQGAFQALGPKDSLFVEIVSLFGLGCGMGLVDGVTNPILGEVAAEHFAGTGKIFVLSNVAVQSGFVIGPIAGNAIVEIGGFSTASLCTGGLLLLYAPLLCRRMESGEKHKALLST